MKQDELRNQFYPETGKNSFEYSILINRSEVNDEYVMWLEKKLLELLTDKEIMKINGYLPPKERAVRLIDRFSDCGEDEEMYIETARKIALVCVSEIEDFMKVDDEVSDTCHNANSKWVQYWIDVRTEILAYKM
jgi:hypothetical protein